MLLNQGHISPGNWLVALVVCGPWCHLSEGDPKFVDAANLERGVLHKAFWNATAWWHRFFRGERDNTSRLVAQHLAGAAGSTPRPTVEQILEADGLGAGVVRIHANSTEA